MTEFKCTGEGPNQNCTTRTFIKEGCVLGCQDGTRVLRCSSVVTP